MKLIKDLINKKIEYYSYFWKKKFYTRAFWQFGQAFNLSCSVLNIELSDKEKSLRNLLYRKLFTELFFREIKESEFQKLDKLIKKDMEIIIRALKYIDELNLNSSVSIGSFYKIGTIGISMDEYPED